MSTLPILLWPIKNPYTCLLANATVMTGAGLQIIWQAIETYLQSHQNVNADSTLQCHVVLDSLDSLLQHAKLPEVMSVILSLHYALRSHAKLVCVVANLPKCIEDTV